MYFELYRGLGRSYEDQASPFAYVQQLFAFETL
jgi:hypothetical protein